MTTIPSSNRFSGLAQTLLANPLFAQAVGTAIQRGMATKTAIDRNLEALLGLLNLPTKADVRKLRTKLEVVQGSLAALHEKLDRVLETAPPRPARKPRARKAPLPRAGSE